MKILESNILLHNFNFNLMVKRISLEQSSLRALNLFYNSRIEFISANVKYVHKKRFYLQNWVAFRQHINTISMNSESPGGNGSLNAVFAFSYVDFLLLRSCFPISCRIILAAALYMGQISSRHE